MIQHGLIKCLGEQVNVEITSLETGTARGPRLVVIRVKPVEYQRPSRQLELLWDIDRRAWLSALLTQGMVTPWFVPGEQHVAMTLDVSPDFRTTHRSFYLLPYPPEEGMEFQKSTYQIQNIERPFSIAFGPRDQYLVLGIWPEYSTATSPIVIRGYSTESTQPVLERTYTNPQTSSGWALQDMALTDRHELLAIIRTDVGDAWSFNLQDLATGQRLTKSVVVEDQIRCMLAANWRGMGWSRGAETASWRSVSSAGGTQ